MCIFGCGCKGILDEPAPKLMQGCCSFGAHFVDDADVATSKSYSTRVNPAHAVPCRGVDARKGYGYPEATRTTKEPDRH